MNTERKDRITVRVTPPFYRQSLDFSCGPACLLMAMGAFDATAELTREAEIDIWRESNLVELYGTCRYGLALSARRRGFFPRILSNAEGILYECVIEDLDIDVDRKTLRFFYDDMRRRCQEAGIPEDPGEVTAEDIGRALKNGAVPIVLSNTSMNSDDDIPHWVIVSGLEVDRVHIYDPTKERPMMVDPDVFEGGLGYRGKRCMISIFDRTER